MTNYVVITLRTDGGLQLEIPGRGTRRKVPIRRLEDIQRVLQGIAQNERFLAQEGAPVESQVSHWQHKSFNQKCPLCVAGRYLAEGGEVSRKRRPLKIEELKGIRI